MIKYISQKLTVCDYILKNNGSTVKNFIRRPVMSKLTIALLVILVILIVALIVLYFTGKKAQKKQEDQKAQIEAAQQTVSMLIIDKKRMPIKDSGLPQFVIDQTPKLMRRSKLPIVKAKVGPRIMTLVCEADIFDLIPL